MRIEISFSRPDPSKRIDKPCQLDFELDWEMPVPRIGERIWLKGLDELEDDQNEPEWRVTDVWWEPDADDYSDEECEPMPHCTVFAQLVGITPDSEEEKQSFYKWYADRQASAVQAERKQEE